MSRHTQFSFILILLFAAALRLAALNHAGLMAVDEGRYLLDGLSKYNELRAWGGLIQARTHEMTGGPELLLADAVPEMELLLREEHPFLPKVVFSYALALVMVFTGFTVWSGALVEALFGVAMVALLYFLARRMFNTRTALISAGLLSVSAYHVFFSRNTYPQCIMAFFFMASVWAHYRGFGCQDRLRWKRYALLTGLFAGLSFAANFQAAGALPALALLHAATCLLCKDSHRQKAILFVAGGALAMAGFMAVMIVMESLTYPSMLLFRSQGLDYPHATFFEMLMPRLTAHAGTAPQWGGVLLFPYFFTVLEGPVGVAALSALCLLSMTVIWRQRGDSPSYVNWLRLSYLLIPLLVPWMAFSFGAMQAARTFIFSLPFLYLLVAVVLDKAWSGTANRTGWARPCTVFLLVAAVASSLFHDVQIMRIRSAYPAVFEYAAAHGNRPVTAAWSSVTKCYAIERAASVSTRINSEDPLHTADWQELYYGRYPDEPIALPDDAKPAAEFEHRFPRFFLSVEAFPSYAHTPWAITWTRALDLARARKVYVYDTAKTGFRDSTESTTRYPQLWELRRN